MTHVDRGMFLWDRVFVSLYEGTVINVINEQHAFFLMQFDTNERMGKV
jgi:hypothetical protein